ncbi:MAG: hypothetical protein EOP59_17600 [Sphingomonadales bacterium]|nr:MAG: hypothetical protein EOP59_17600 [Sphingomonadales bacterium]
MAAIGDPDDVLVRALIEKLLVRRGLAVPRAVLTYLSRRVERSYVGIHRIVDAIDEAALGRRSALSVARAREALARLHVIDESSMIG